MRTFVLAVMLAAWCPYPISAQEPAVAFVGVTVIPMDRERVLENQTVIVSDGRIAVMGPASSVAIPAGATRVDGRGKFLLPGLSDMHGHLPQGDATGRDALSEFLDLYLANGVTTVRGLQGSPNNIVVRDKIRRGELDGPRIFAASPPLHQKVAPTPAEGIAQVEAAKAAGYDLIKVHEGLSPETYDAISATAKRLGMKVAGHVTATVGLERALAAGQSSIEHLDGYLQAMVPKDSPVPPPAGQVVIGPVLAYIDESRIPQLAAATRDAHVWNTPTLTLFEIVVSSDTPESFLAWPEMQYVSPNLRSVFQQQKAGTVNIPATPEERSRYLELRSRMTKGLVDAGAQLLVGPDTPQLFLVPGFATHREMTSLVHAGLTPFQALQAATTSPAEYLGILGDTGTVAEGKRADLLLVEGNPMQEIANAHKIAGVMANGHWLPRSELDRRLAAIAAAHRQ
jgi:imidazolonepropionase-like amidohydrolase